MRPSDLVTFSQAKESAHELFICTQTTSEVLHSGNQLNMSFKYKHAAHLERLWYAVHITEGFSSVSTTSFIGPFISGCLANSDYVECTWLLVTPCAVQMYVRCSIGWVTNDSPCWKSTNGRKQTGLEDTSSNLKRLKATVSTSAPGSL